MILFILLCGSFPFHGSGERLFESIEKGKFTVNMQILCRLLHWSPLSVVVFIRLISNLILLRNFGKIICISVKMSSDYRMLQIFCGDNCLVLIFFSLISFQ